MELYIRIKNGQPFEHPIVGGNFREVFPDIDTNNLPAEFARFERLECLVKPTIYQMAECEYVPNGSGWKDSWSIREMTAEEIIAKQNAVKEAWKSHAFQSWVFNETVCTFEAPTPMPLDGKRYYWDEPSVSWVEVTTV
jgi:hypothetical protein